MIVTGQIEKITARKTQWGELYSVLVGGKYYGIGKKRPAFSDGDYVTFEAETNAKGYLDADPQSFKKATTPVGATTSADAPKRSTWIPDDKRQDAISYQAARNSAIAFVQLLQTAGLIDKGKMKGAEAIAQLEVFLDNYTKRFFEDTKTLGHKAEVSVDLGDGPNDSIENI